MSATGASATTESNPFMSIKAQSFMPTTFVPSPNKNAQVLTFNSAHFSPLKVSNFS